MEVLCMSDGGDTRVRFWHGRGSEHKHSAVELKLAAGHGLWRGGDIWVIFFPRCMMQTLGTLKGCWGITQALVADPGL